MTFPKNRSNRNIKENLRRDFFQIAAHFVFAIIVAQSFLIATELLIPLNMIFENDDKFLRTASLFLAYVVIISGWVGYARSMSEKPHKDDIKGAFRFLLDLIILFEYFYLLQLTITTKYFQDEFHWVLVFIFSTYLIWDIVKYFEYRGKKERKITRSRGGWTLVFFIICLAVALCYHFLVVEGISELEIFKDKQSQTLNFIVLMLVVNLGYRIFKWNTRNKKTSFT